MKSSFIASSIFFFFLFFFVSISRLILDHEESGRKFPEFREEYPFTPLNRLKLIELELEFRRRINVFRCSVKIALGSKWDRIFFNFSQISRKQFRISKSEIYIYIYRKSLIIFSIGIILILHSR